MKSQGIPMLAFLIVAGICGAVGYVIGESRHVLLQERLVNLGYADWCTHKATGRREFVWAMRNAEDCPSWEATFASRPELFRHR